MILQLRAIDLKFVDINAKEEDLLKTNRVFSKIDSMAINTYNPPPSVKDFNNYYPATECLSRNEMRVTIMGSRPFPPHRRQACTSIMVELGIGQRFFFDLGLGCLRNIIGMRVPIQCVNDIFLSHLHVDHYGDLPYLYTFAPHNGRYTPLRVTGPSGSSPEFGTKAMIAGMQAMTLWNIDSINIMPVGNGASIEVTEFDWSDDGGICYDKKGVQIKHWRRSHTKDGASAYRLDWDGPSFVWTGDGRPDELTIKYSNGVDLFVTEAMMDNQGLISTKWGVDNEIVDYILDTHHTPHYAAGFMMKQIKPRAGVITHCDESMTTVPELLNGIRTHWKGPLVFGKDLTVINITKDAMWIREGVASDAAENPNQDGDQVFRRKFNSVESNDIPPYPKRSREEMQEEKTRNNEIDPKKYYPAGFLRKLVTRWPK
jgi:ribonuclease Z